MSRPQRPEFEGALYHVTSRRDRREPIFEDDADRNSWLAVFAQGLERFDATAFAYRLMGNHYHFVVQTHQPNLSRLMRQINGVYTQSYNRRHVKVGHLFQGRFKAVAVDEEAYVLEVCLERGHTQTAIARATGLSVSRISRLIAEQKAKGRT